MPRPEPRLPPQKKQKKAERLKKNPSSLSHNTEIPTPSRQKKMEEKEEIQSRDCQKKNRQRTKDVVLKTDLKIRFGLVR